MVVATLIAAATQATSRRDDWKSVMHSREQFVGTIYIRSNTLLRKFLGEGADHVVYEAGDPDTGLPNGEVLKFRKPQAFLEMKALHYDFKVSDRWPVHPLRQTPEARFGILLSEMMARV